MEQQEEELGEERGQQEPGGELNGQRDLGVSRGQTLVKGQTGQATDEQGGGVKDVHDKVVAFGLDDAGQREDILNVFNMSTTAHVDQNDA